MGTPDFAVPTLKALCLSRHEISVVVTGPDKPVGRSGRLRPTPVKTAAAELEIPILQPADLRDLIFENDLRTFQPDICVVVAFRILPDNIIYLPEKGCINLHPSLLPDLRGAAPVNWALIRGYERTGITTFLLEKTIDTGSILLQEEVRIDPSDDAGSLSVRLSESGASLVVKTLDLMDSQATVSWKQEGKVSQAPKISTETCCIHWDKPAIDIHNLVRGLSPKPTAYTTLGGKKLKVFRTDPRGETCYAEPGRIMPGDDELLTVATGRGTINILELQIEDRQRMTSADFLRGRKIADGTVLG